MPSPRQAACFALASLSLCATFATAVVDGAAKAQAKSLAIVQRFKGPDGSWDFMAVDAAAHRLYVARSYGVLSVDLASGAVTDKLVDGAGVHGVLPLQGGSLVLSSNGKSNNALMFDGASGKVEATIATGNSPDAMVFEPKSGLVAIFNGKTRDASLLDPKTRQVVATIALDGKPEVAAADGQGRIFVNLEDKAEIAVLDAASHAVKSRYALPGCEGPTGLALDRQTGVLVSACDNQSPRLSMLRPARIRDPADLRRAGQRHAGRQAAPPVHPCADGQMSVLSLAGTQEKPEVKVSATVATGPRAKTGAWMKNPAVSISARPSSRRRKSRATSPRRCPAPSKSSFSPTKIEALHDEDPFRSPGPVADRRPGAGQGADFRHARAIAGGFPSCSTRLPTAPKSRRRSWRNCTRSKRPAPLSRLRPPRPTTSTKPSSSTRPCWATPSPSRTCR